MVLESTKIKPFLILVLLALPISLKSQDNNDEVESGFNRITSHFNRNRNRPIKEQRSSPIILVPGDGGSQLEALLDKTDVPHYFCDKKTSEWFDLWLNLALLVPFVIDCWIDNMRLVYDNTTRKTLNAPGVEIRAPGFGNTSCVEYVDPSRVPVSGYFNNLVNDLVSFGYQRGISIRAAPYDFRKAPNELSEYFEAVESLIEETYEINDQQKVVLLCHSMGCPTMLYFLNRKPQNWKDRYIRSFVTLAAPWGGAVKSLKAFASGDNFGVVVVPSLTIRQDERTFPSLAYLLPSDKFWSNDEVLMESAFRNYTVSNYKEFFEDINYLVGYNMWLDTKNLTYDLQAPGVEVYCLHGEGEETMDNLIYNKGKFPDSQPHIVFGNGDGTVNSRSLRGCLQWQEQQEQPIHYQNFSKVDHMEIMSDPNVLNYIRNVVKLND